MKYLLPLLTLFFMTTACKNTGPSGPGISYPETKKVDTVDTYFGTQVADPYRWLEFPDTGEVTAVKDWVDAQNKVTFGYLAQIPFRNQLKSRLEKVWNYPKYGAPSHRGDHYFYHKNNGLQNQSVLYIMDSLNAEGREFLDPNKFSADGTTSLTTFSVSKDGKKVVYGTSKGGSDWNEFFVMDIPSGEKNSDHLNWIKFSGAAWKGDGFYYGRFASPVEGQELKSSNENKQIFFHKLGTDQSEDKLIYQEPEHPKRGIYASTTEDERFLLIYLSEGATNDNALSVLNLDKKGATVQPIITDFDNNFDVVDNIGDKLMVVTNHNAPRKRVIMIDVNHPEEANWEELIPQKDEVLLGVSLVGGKIISQYLKDASAKLYLHKLNGSIEQEIVLPTVGTVNGISGRKEDKIAFYTFTSFNYPPTIFKLDLETAKSDVFRKSEIDFDPDAYVTEQVFFNSKDGTRIPVFLVHKKDLPKDGERPTLLYGYGGFNVNILPQFAISIIPLLENGGVYAVATLRGGGEYGEEWHKDGMLLKKQNVFDDFIGAGEFLIKEKYTNPGRLAIAGGSNGGLLVGAAMCQRPDLFKVALPAVGVMDMLRFHKFTIGHAWVVEYGSSERTQEEFENLLAFSPLHNMKEGTEYPATMVFTADHDDRVVPYHSFKFISRLQAVQAGKSPVLIRIETQAGHGAGKPTDKIIEEAADKWAFMFYNMGFTPTE